MKVVQAPIVGDLPKIKTPERVFRMDFLGWLLMPAMLLNQYRVSVAMNYDKPATLQVIRVPILIALRTIKSHSSKE